MNFKFPVILVILLSIQFCFASERIVTELNTARFIKGESASAFKSDFDDSDWRVVKLPHDWGIEGPVIPDGDGNTAKLPWKGEAWYRIPLQIPQNYEGRQIYLLCDGIMAFPQIYVNGELAGKWDYGYSSFYVDITKFLQYDKSNSLAIHVDTRNHDSRWYPGAGIYRKIQMIAVDPVHVDIWGVHISTPIIKPHYADVRIAATIKNDTNSEKHIAVKHTIYDANQIKIASIDTVKRINANSNILSEVTMTITDPVRWDVDNPHLYKVITEISDDEHTLDTVSNTFGVRSMRFTADNGFYLNDKRVQFKGVNLHHGHGPLGTVFNKQAMQRQLEIMKNMGCNAIRTSHNIPAPELLDLCDEMGLLVFDEIFDKYDGKADIMDTTNFDHFAHRNIRNFVVRDRNHPSIFIWSVGNEIGDVQTNYDNGFLKLQTMISYVKKYDNSRPTTLVCDQLDNAKTRHFDYYDIHSWNYGRRWRLARQLEPNKAVIISESASTVSTRGFYEFPLPKDRTAFTNSLQISSYDLYAPRWAEVADDDFMWQQDEPYIAGEFVWTGFDYLGEPTPYRNVWVKQQGMTDEDASRSSYFGIVDLCGIPKDRYYLYKSYWKPDETTIHILPHWNWPDRIGKTVPVFVYTNGDCAELFLNGKSLGKQYKKPKSENSIERFRLMWNDVIYQPGEIKAVAYKAGQPIGENTVVTTGEPYRLRLTPDRKVIHANGQDLSYVLIEALDKEGNCHPLANNLIKIEISGNGKNVGVGNGDPQCMSEFKSDTIELFYGKAMLIVQSEKDAGNITVKASAEGLKDADVRIKTE